MNWKFTFLLVACKGCDAWCLHCSMFDPSHVCHMGAGYAKFGPYTMAEELPLGMGSGFIWDTKGHVVTNFHVIRGANAIKVTLIDSNTYPAKVLASFFSKSSCILLATVSGPERYFPHALCGGLPNHLRWTASEISPFKLLLHFGFSVCVCVWGEGAGAGPPASGDVSMSQGVEGLQGTQPRKCLPMRVPRTCFLQEAKTCICALCMSSMCMHIYVNVYINARHCIPVRHLHKLPDASQSELPTARPSSPCRMPSPLLSRMAASPFKGS